ncbi:MAG: hypothetical protein KKC99_00640 [Proteobacteria bacterium]|nr:hypothetical protein [Pseudomonadota bacterium]
MGQEIGWYLRFSRGGQVEVLVNPSALGQLENQLHIVPGWRMSTEEQDGNLRALFTRTPF